MASTFRPVNTPLSPSQMGGSDRNSATMSPATPTPAPAADVVEAPAAEQQPTPKPAAADDARTPTRASFQASSALASQKPLPSSPFPDSVQVPEPEKQKTPRRNNSQHSGRSDAMDMGDSDGDGTHGDDGGASDDDSVDVDGSRSNKKKKSQRFYCTDYPPCNLSFTRSEHLARHIRKHTGERPFQCHCSRRFSRLDNLRQHAQTVHVNEDIPIDSLAATGTRFQRQIRTDRVRPVTNRARASTAGSVGSPARGHSKSLSTSSIASNVSIASNYSVNEGGRRRPPPLVMADPRARMPLEAAYPMPHESHYYRPASPSDFSTPTSATFSVSQDSPRWGSGVASPTSSHSRSQSMYAGSRTPGRRLSVPSVGGNPFQSPHGMTMASVAPRPLGVHGPMAPSGGGGPFSPGNGGSLLSSPTSSTSGWSRRDSTSSVADEAWRRRTWHPDTRDYNGASRLSQVITPSQLTPPSVPLPIAHPHQQAQQPMRLPGIESFDAVPQRPHTPTRRAPSPMMIDSEPPSAVDDRHGGSSSAGHWDAGLHRGLTRLDINTPPRDAVGSWAADASHHAAAPPPPPQVEQQPHQQQPLRPGMPMQQTVRFDADVKPARVPAPPAHGGGRHHYTLSAPPIHTTTTTTREAKRHGWYNGPVNGYHHDGGYGPEPRSSQVDRMIHPNVGAFQAFPPREHAAAGHHQQPAGGDQPRADGDPLRRLEALVAVATSEGSTAAAY